MRVGICATLEAWDHSHAMLVDAGVKIAVPNVEYEVRVRHIDAVPDADGDRCTWDDRAFKG